MLINKCFSNKIKGKLNCSKNKIFINLQKKIEKVETKFLFLFFDVIFKYGIK